MNFILHYQQPDCCELEMMPAVLASSETLLDTGLEDMVYPGEEYGW